MIITDFCNAEFTALHAGEMPVLISLALIELHTSVSQQSAILQLYRNTLINKNIPMLCNTISCTARGKI